MSKRFFVLLTVLSVLGVLGLGINDGTIVILINWGTFLSELIKNVVYGALVNCLFFWLEIPSKFFCKK
ncbi:MULTISPECIES: hypothetical protein [Bacillus cereus group]|uniref:Uncharacterized protein n=1 Tax=Bacillus cereus TaxID=1396 RepID=A0A5B9HWG2_BACCE|nr:MULTISPECIES: hypothetical protein [Bacillus cereus group]MCU5037848.1 hypothetical protein [Bacillus cereus]OTX86487.1 hypothetical protein BK726_17870 [Bacillus thuringiensis serovar londrina]PEC90970.1 hypothetical protein CON02_11970 [Bacillus cereus]PFO02524.1 hypothetical protein COJ68_03510 [Bacillus cereus]PFO47207.1 hypothetical protein COJ71_22490 [Bacillus cereus]